MRKAVNAIIIRSKALLLFRKNETWILPGGKPEEGENNLECLVREFEEEASGAEIRISKYYGRFIGTTPHRGDELTAHVYFADIFGEKNVRPSAEIEEAKYVRSFGNYNISDITLKVIERLQEEGYL